MRLALEAIVIRGLARVAEGLKRFDGRRMDRLVDERPNRTNRPACHGLRAGEAAQREAEP